LAVVKQLLLLLCQSNTKREYHIGYVGVLCCWLSNNCSNA